MADQPTKGAKKPKGKPRGRKIPPAPHRSAKKPGTPKGRPKPPRTATPAGQPRPPGRVPKWTPEVQEKITTALMLGLPYKMAAMAGGISYDTFNEWRKLGEFADESVPDDDPMRRFFAATEEANQHFLVQTYAQIVAAGQDGKNWQANRWRMQVRFPGEFPDAPVVSVHQNPDGTPIAQPNANTLVFFGIPDNGNEKDAPDEEDDDEYPDDPSDEDEGGDDDA